MHINGACHCGAITFTAEVDPSRVLVCHCSDCQVLSGSPFRVVVVAPIETFAVQGAPTGYVKVAQNGNRRVQTFCPHCGTPLYACAPEDPTWVSIRLRPSLQIWQHSAAPWLSELSAIPGSPEQEAFLPVPPP